MVEMAFNKKADFSLQAAYLSASDSQYTQYNNIIIDYRRKPL